MKPQRLFRIGRIAIIVALVFLISVNVLDYVCFRQAVSRARHLSHEQLVALADYCRTVTREQTDRVSGKAVPAVFKPLQPVDVTLFPGMSYACLYRRGEIYLQFTVTTVPNNQSIEFSYDTNGEGGGALLWERDPEASKRLSPSGRLLTFSQFAALSGGQREWIVLPDRLLVIDRSFRGEGDKQVANVPLTADDRAEIEAAVRAVPHQLKGKVYRDDRVIDGIGFSISFTTDGQMGTDGIHLENAWIDPFGPLISVVGKFTPPAFPLEYPNIIRSGAKDHPGALAPTVRTREEMRRHLRERPRTPWWCWWPLIAH